MRFPLRLTFTGIVYSTLAVDRCQRLSGPNSVHHAENRCCYVQRNLFAHTLWNGSSMILYRGEENVRKYRHKSFHGS